ncbi:hypothetical protein [Paracoccus versutus]|uniref:Uncharacterized protein n=1 Tax=Paracoccus versutus TaxID=34007 RepID=A0A3D9XA03_PARVE|nr:hypothetical protein [Paracoccus versutus]REF67386.1 hypothetical protein BDD41_4411 [Paracoccus versutus]WGR58653.1 hypothetical protein E3U25_22380 [Paracoccus versutus]
MIGQTFAAVDRIEIVGGSARGLRTRRGALAALGVPMACPARFMVLLVEDDGGQAVLWDGASYAEAIIEAERRAVVWRVPVLDRVVE